MSSAARAARKSAPSRSAPSSASSRLSGSCRAGVCRAALASTAAALPPHCHRRGGTFKSSCHRCLTSRALYTDSTSRILLPVEPVPRAPHPRAARVNSSWRGSPPRSPSPATACGATWLPMDRYSRLSCSRSASRRCTNALVRPTRRVACCGCAAAAAVALLVTASHPPSRLPHHR